jgi:hypothetical protein
MYFALISTAWKFSDPPTLRFVDLHLGTAYREVGVRVLLNPYFDFSF